MVSPLQGSIRRTIGKAMKSVFYPVTVIRSVPGEGGTPWEPAPPVDVEYPCRGIIDGYSDFQLTTNTIQSGDRKVIVLADSLSITPETGDRIRARGQTFTIVNVATDPAEATWTLQARL